jgi:GNAT acetyltransferase-like protein
MTFDELNPLDDPEWDSRIAKYPSKYVFHERAWLRFVARSQSAQIRGARLVGDDGATLGYFAAGQVRKGPFRLLGSPLQGWTTPAIGPVADKVPASFPAALETYCRQHDADYVEICNRVLPAAMMLAAGFSLDADETLLVRIGSESEMWTRLSSECRNRIRRGMRNGLQVVAASDRTFIETYYAQLCDVFARQGLVPTYGVDRVASLWDTLLPVGRLVALSVERDGEPLATGLFPFDDRALFFWGGASWTRAYESPCASRPSARSRSTT